MEIVILDRRDSILDKIVARLSITDTGYVSDGKPSPCHLWTGSDSGKGRGGGYGKVSLNNVMCYVHVVVYTHYYGYIPPGKQIDHLCNQRRCCNPQHLELVTHLQNQRRRVKRMKCE